MTEKKKLPSLEYRIFWAVVALTWVVINAYRLVALDEVWWRSLISGLLALAWTYGFAINAAPIVRREY